MASKSQWRHQERRVLSPSELEARVQQALREGRSQQALELARNLFKQDCSPAHLELVQKATVERARQLRAQGHVQDAGTLLANAVELGGPEFLRDVAQEMARCGEIQNALCLVDQIDDPKPRKRIVAQAADHAVRQGAAGRGLLAGPEQQQFDLALKAFREMEVGQDEAARATLQGIGLQSPFLEWKLLIRGFIAYYQKDDARAIDNWQRLDAERLPVRLAAPFRALIDKGFMQAQPPASQEALRAAADRLQGSGLVTSLRRLQALLADDEQMATAFRLAETIVPALKQMQPALATRLANCVYWAVIQDGQPEDKQRYLRVFGAPAHDPQLLRMDCLALDHCQNRPHAHVAWQAFDNWLSVDPAWGSAEVRQRVRALVWCHLGENADRVAQPPEFLPSFLRGRPKNTKLDPSAEKCYLQSLKLAPDLLEAHEALFHHYQRENKAAKAIKAGNDLLKQFPDHAATLEALGDLCLTTKQFGKALEYFQRTLAVNPLQRGLRERVAFVHQVQARHFVTGRLFDEARKAHRAALDISEPADRHMILAKWATCEMKAGDRARADELLAEARAGGRHAPAVAYYLVIEAARLKLPKAVKDQLAREFAAMLGQPPTPEAAVALLNIAAAHRQADVGYHGQKTHEKKVLAYLGKAASLDWPEEQLERICAALLEVQPGRVFQRFVRRGRIHHRDNPVFLIREAEAILAEKGDAWRAGPLLTAALQKTRALPPGERQTRLLDQIHELQDLTRSKDMPMGFPDMNVFEELFNAFGDNSDDDDYEDDDDWEDL